MRGFERTVGALNMEVFVSIAVLRRKEANGVTGTFGFVERLVGVQEQSCGVVLFRNEHGYAKA